MATTLSTPADAELVAVGSRTAAAAERFAERFDVPHPFGSYDALAVADDIDVVYVATTNDLHCENTLMYLAAGKAVLCEKPLALNHHQAADMATTARSNGRFLMEAMWMRFLPFVAKIDELVAAGSIGPVRHVQADFGFPADPDPGRRWFDPGLGGGSLLDVGIYPFTLAYHILGEPEQVEAVVSTAPSGVDGRDRRPLPGRSGGHPHGQPGGRHWYGSHHFGARRQNQGA